MVPIQSLNTKSTTMQCQSGFRIMVILSGFEIFGFARWKINAIIMETKMNRRHFMKSTAASVGLFSIVPAHVLGKNGQTPPSGKLNIAGVGVGGMGKGNLGA